MRYNSGQYDQYYDLEGNAYQRFTPSLINGPYQWTDQKITLLLEKTAFALGELNAHLLLVPDADLFVRMHIIKEAVASVRIEGIRIEINEAVLSREELAPEKHADWDQVQDYVKTINSAIKKLRKQPLNIRLVNETHKKILASIRGEETHPGEIRKSQNWSGDSDVKKASFVPPHPDKLPRLLTDLQKYWHNEALHLPILIKVAVSHYQFETIHPYLDGNGRAGRLLATLQIADYQLLHKPILYFSEYLLCHQEDYFNALTKVRKSNDMEQWITFFLQGILETAIKGKETLEIIIKLRFQYEKKINTFGKQALLGEKLLLYLFSHPVISVQQAAELLNVSLNTANKLVSKLQREGILKQITTISDKKYFELHQYQASFKN